MWRNEFHVKSPVNHMIIRLVSCWWILIRAHFKFPSDLYKNNNNNNYNKNLKLTRVFGRHHHHHHHRDRRPVCTRSVCPCPMLCSRLPEQKVKLLLAPLETVLAAEKLGGDVINGREGTMDAFTGLVLQLSHTFIFSNNVQAAEREQHTLHTHTHRPGNKCPNFLESINNNNNNK